MNAEYERVRALLPKLTKPQLDLLTIVCGGVSSVTAHPRTVIALVRHGLIKQYVEMHNGRSLECVHRYDVSADTWRAWWEYYEELPTDGVVQ